MKFALFKAGLNFPRGGRKLFGFALNVQTQATTLQNCGTNYRKSTSFASIRRIRQFVRH